jgi:hypothetical protein
MASVVNTLVYGLAFSCRQLFVGGRRVGVWTNSTQLSIQTSFWHFTVVVKRLLLFLHTKVHNSNTFLIPNCCSHDFTS